MSDMTVEKAQALLVTATPGPWRVDGEPWKQVVWSFPDNRVCFMSHSNGLDDARDAATAELIAAAPDLARAYIAQADELTRLRAKVDAADKLAQQSEDYIDGLTTSEHVRAALSAYEEKKDE